MNTKKEEVYEIIHEGPEFEMAIRLIPVRYSKSDIVKVSIDGEMCGYKMIPKPCRVDPKKFPIFDPDLVEELWFLPDEIAWWIEKTIEINESDIDFSSYIKDDFLAMKNQIYIRLCLDNRFPPEIPSKKFKMFKIIYEVELFIDELRFRVTVDNNMLERWGITLQKLDKIAMENSIRDYPPILRTWRDLGKGTYNLLSGDMPDTIDKSYALITPGMFHSVSALAYPGVLEKIAEITDDDFDFLAKNAGCVMLTASNKVFDDWFIKLERKFPELVCNEDYFSSLAYTYFRETGEITIE